MRLNELALRRLAEDAEAVGQCDLKIPVHLYLSAIGFAMRSLSILERDALRLRFVEALPIARVAERLKMSWDGAASLIDQAVRKVHRVLMGSRWEHKQLTSEEAYEANSAPA